MTLFHGSHHQKNHHHENGHSAEPASLASNGAGTSNPYAGHVGNLTETQAQSLNAFKALCFAQALYQPGPPASHDDATLLRYLRARKWDVNAALAQFKEAEAWRKSSDVDRFFVEHDIETYDQARRVYPCWTGRRTKRGAPYYIYKVDDLDKKTMDRFLSHATEKAEKSNKPPSVVALYESLLQLVLPLSSKLQDRPHTETPITQSCNIIDISGVSLKKFLYLRGHLGDASALATARYPETLESIIVIGAPSYVEMIFQFISKWFDANMRAKIKVLGTSEGSNLKHLEELIDIKDIPTQYGGQMQWGFGDLPNLDPEVSRAFGVQNSQWPIGPIKLIDNDIVAMGTRSDGTLRREVIGSLRPDAYPAQLHA